MNTDDAADSERSSSRNGDKMFTLKKWNAVAMWSWDVECDTCAICRVQVMGKISLIFHITVLLFLLLMPIFPYVCHFVRTIDITCACTVGLQRKAASSQCLDCRAA